MSELDRILNRLGSLPPPAALDGIDDAVIAGLAAQRTEAAIGRGAMAVAGAFALLLGLGSGGLVVGRPAPVQAAAPFAADHPLAPSTLLGVHS